MTKSGNTLAGLYCSEKVLIINYLQDIKKQVIFKDIISAYCILKLFEISLNFFTCAVIGSKHPNKNSCRASPATIS
jgi:hypothetical protein